MVEQVATDNAVRLIDQCVTTLKATALERRLQLDGFGRTKAPVEPREHDARISLRFSPNRSMDQRGNNVTSAPVSTRAGTWETDELRPSSVRRVRRATGAGGWYR